MKTVNEKEYDIYIKGFEDGYAMAKRLYNVKYLVIESEDGYKKYLKKSNDKRFNSKKKMMISD